MFGFFLDIRRLLSEILDTLHSILRVLLRIEQELKPPPPVHRTASISARFTNPHEGE